MVKLQKTVALVCLGMAFFVFSGEARSQVIGFGTAGLYNEYTLGNSTRTNVDTQGRAAVGGIAQYTNFTVASQIPANSGIPTLVVGGTLNASGASLNGSTYVAGNATYTTPTINGSYGGVTFNDVFAANGSVTFGSGGQVKANVRFGTTYSPNGSTVPGSVTGPVSTAMPVDFATTNNYVKALSLGQFKATDPSVGLAFNALNISTASGTPDPGTNSYFFNVTGADFSNSTSGFNITASATDTVVINVSGTTINTPNTGFNLSGGITVNHLVFNFYQATSLVVSSARGSFLAPLAATTGNSGGFNGNLIVGSLTGSIETHIFDGGGTSGQSTLFDGTLRSVAIPEPVTLVMIALAMAGAYVVWLWKKRQAKQLLEEQVVA